MNPPGGCSSAQTSSQGIQCSFLLHRSEDPKRIAKHFRATLCPRENELVGMLSCPQAEAHALDRFQKDFQEINKGYHGLFFKENGKGENNPKEDKKIIEEPAEKKLTNADKVFCPDCKTKLIFAGGCHGGSCPNPDCGYSSC